MNTLGTHVLLDLYTCSCDFLNNPSIIKIVLIEAVEEIGAEMLNVFIHRFSPQGVTGIVAIAESHISIHTWPEYKFAAVDIFTCGNITSEKAEDFFVEKFKPRRVESRKVSRGIY